ncbi:hypothetical protein [Yinghuangia soli]|uniref:Lipoprotein n=1 Tax=Yinghuangia soli TaxID=2908204 RepID=A0AA41Q0C9_9ACTN|nr:hypothetical protein [Yinghuangia soli]MCF2529238.1 hypothetical protein [Yinghuangia soli]
MSVAPKIPANLAVAAACAAVLALTAGCSDDGDGKNKSLAGWAAKVCTADVTAKIDESKTALADISVVLPGEKPDALRTRLAEDVSRLAAANTALADALGRAGDPDVDGGKEQRAALVSEQLAIATGWHTVKTQLEALPTADQKAFADGLRALQPSIAGTVTTSNAALEKLHTGELGKALAAVSGCVASLPAAGGASSAPGTASGSAPATTAPPASAPASPPASEPAGSPAATPAGTPAATPPATPPATTPAPTAAS